jgi:hypothetical protein
MLATLALIVVGYIVSTEAAKVRFFRTPRR